MGPEQLRERLAEVTDRMAAAARRSGRDPSAVRLVAVTKGHPAEVIDAALTCGLTDIGESRVQEARAKRGAVRHEPGGARWHLVGHLQRNKARAAAELFDVVHSLDSEAIADALALHRPQGVAALPVLIEVDLTDLPSRTGVSPEQLASLFDHVVALPSLAVCGLMTIAPPGAPAGAAAVFARLRGLRDQLDEGRGVGLPELSMGMSDDYEVAVEEGATLVRLGRALFGDRPGSEPLPPSRLS